MKNKLILFDIDFTLFNMELYRQAVYDKLQELHPKVNNIPKIAQETYEDLRKVSIFDPKLFSEYFLQRVSSSIDPEILASLWYDDELFTSAIYPEAEEVLSTLSKDTRNILGLFSSGYEKLQLAKIKTLVHFFAKDKIHIDAIKDKNLPTIVSRNEDKRIILIDDFIPVLEKGKAASLVMTTIWMKRGTLADKFTMSERFPPDFTVTNLTQVPPIIASI